MKRIKGMKACVSAVLAGMTAMVGLAPMTAFAQSKEAVCICEEKCQESSINEECEVCIYDYNFCEGKETIEGKPEENGEPLTPDGNMNLVDDYGSFEAGGKQFITVTTKSGNYFYIIIDRDDKGTENVHFLNLVDESDLLALMEEEEVDAYLKSHGLTENKEEITEPETMTEEEIKQPEKEESEPESEEKSPNLTGIMGLILILTLGGIGGFVYFNSAKKKKPQSTVDPDVDYSDEDEEDYLADLNMEEDSASEDTEEEE